MPRTKTAVLPETAQVPATVEVIPQAHEHMADRKPKPRRFLMRANANCPKEGAFNGTCLVYEGDQWEHIFYPVWRQNRDSKGRPITGRDGRPVMGWVEAPLPLWADAVEEYELEIAPRPVARARLPGAAPEFPAPASKPMAAPMGLGPDLPSEGVHR